MIHSQKLIHILGLVLILTPFTNAGAGTDPSQNAPWTSVSRAELPSENLEGEKENLKLTLNRQIARCQELKDPKPWTFGNRTLPQAIWCQQTHQALLKILNESSSWEQIFDRVYSEFEWYRSVGVDGKSLVKFTGYYTPTLEARKKPEGEFQTPLYRLPENLVPTTGEDGKPTFRKRNPDGSLSPFFTRKQIDFEGALVGLGLEMAYVKTLLDAYVFHIQGSGRIVFSPTESTFFQHVANNGYGYVSLSKAFEPNGIDPRYRDGLPGLKRYFRDYPTELSRVLPVNPRYIFFKETQDGPTGKAGTLLVPQHSIATDSWIFPQGALALIRSKRPIFENQQVVRWQEYTRLVLNQDTGGAIQGPGRVDVYWGGTDEAEAIAGITNLEPGQLFFAVLKEKESKSK